MMRNRQPSWPSARLTGAPASKVDARQFMSLHQMRAWYEELDDCGLRATGSTVQERYIDRLQERMMRVGMAHLRSEPVAFKSWTPSSWSVDVMSGTDAGPMPIAAYIPYSGALPPEGTTGQLHYIAPGAPMAPGSLKGKIALVQMTIPHTNLQPLYSMSHDRYDPDKLMPLDREYLRVWLSDIHARLPFIRAAAPLAMIAILPLDDPSAAGLYTPYDGVIRDCPGLYVSRTYGARLKLQADAGTPVRVRLNATAQPATSRNLLGVIPGRSKEMVLLHSHTDGPNGIEDNGPDLILSMAQYLSRIPQELLPRSILFVLTTGHFAGGVGSRNFVNRHRDDILAGVVASVTVEHVGAMDMAITPEGSFRSTGAMEPALVFMPPGAHVLSQGVVAGLVSGRMGGTFLAGPTNPHPQSMETASAWPGEGEYLWNGAGLPEANYITGPNYLFNAGYPTAKHVDFERMRRASMGFVDMVLGLSRIPAETLKVTPPRDRPTA